MASFVQQSTAQVEEDQEHQPGPHSSRSQSQCHQWSNHPPHAPRHEEIKIREGPLYSPQTPYRNSSNEYLLDYGRNATAVTSFTEAIQGGAGIFDDSNETSNQLLQHFVSPMAAETTALLIVDVQPEYWSNCPAVRKDFPDFPKNLQRTIEVARQRKAKIIWVRADYRYSHSPWLPQFERIRGDRNLGEVPCDPTSPEFNWEDFAKPQGGEVIITKSSWSSTTNTAQNSAKVLPRNCVWRALKLSWCVG